MAAPAALIAAKAALAALADEKGRKAVGGIVIAILSPVILIIVVIVSMLSATAEHNNAALRLSFEGQSLSGSGAISSQVPDDYRRHIENMRESFASLENVLAEIGSECEWEDGEPDVLRIKSVFYALFFGSDFPQSHANRAFVDCFLTYETRTRPCTDSSHHDDDDEDEDCEEEYTVAIPITDLPTVYQNVGALTGRPITPEDAANITEIYRRVASGDYSSSNPPDSLTGGMNGTHDRIADLIAGDDTPFVGGDFVSPIAGNWRSVVSCEFGTGYVGHTGMDLAIPTGTEIRAVAAGKVLYTKMSSDGYGYHVVINHGGGIVTLYAHNSRILVSEGQEVAQGQAVALSGSTGNSTGPHLHIEFIVDGVPRNPRSYLP